MSSFATIVATPEKCVGLKSILEARLSGSADLEQGGEALPIHFFDGGREQQIALRRFEFCRILFESARIGAEILGRGKLRRIDENRHHDAAGMLLRQSD